MLDFGMYGIVGLLAKSTLLVSCILLQVDVMVKIKGLVCHPKTLSNGPRKSSCMWGTMSVLPFAV